MWAAWDFINRKMIPPSMLFQKPIDLRHICLFYQGHIPTFLDIHLSRLLQEPHTEPENFKVRKPLCNGSRSSNFHVNSTSSRSALLHYSSILVLTTCREGLILT